MSPKVLFIHARNQIRTVWLMTGSRYASSYDIQTRNPSLVLSIVALLLGYVLFAVYDYLYYPTELLAGMIPVDMSRTAYVAIYSASYLLGILLAYGALFLLAMPMGYSKRFWHGLIALNWWNLIIAFAIFPLLLIMLLMSDDDPFLSPLIAFLFFIFILIVWKSILLIRHVLRISSAKAVLLTLVFISAQLGVMAIVLEMAGISLF